MRRRTAAGLCIAIALAGCAACTALREPQDAGATEHARQSEQLRSRMRELGRLRDERLPKALDPGLERSHRVDAVAAAAAEIAAWAAAIRLDSAAGPAEVTARRAFDARAADLQRLASELAEQAGGWTDSRLREQLRAIDAACEGCHGGQRR